jgi:hypothetical protein
MRPTTKFLKRCAATFAPYYRANGWTWCPNPTNGLDPRGDCIPTEREIFNVLERLSRDRGDGNTISSGGLEICCEDGEMVMSFVHNMVDREKSV